jgi:ATP-dependent RNA/DNA helicase IGHMBP2
LSQAYSQRIHDLITAIDHERRHDEAMYLKLKSSTSILEKVSSGLMWYPIQVHNRRYILGDYIEVELERTKSLELSHKFTEGIAVLLTHQNTEVNPIRAIISGIKQHKMWILIHQDLADDLDEYDRGLYGVEMVYDDKPYTVMTAALRKLLDKPEPHTRSILDAIYNPDYISSPLIDELSRTDLEHRRDLNPSQIAAIKSSLTSADLAVIHGPPGTGKTTTIVALVQELARTEKRILVCASSNNAVDLLARRLSVKGLKVLRIGNITRIHDDLLSLTLEEKTQSHADWQHIKKVRIKIHELDKKASQYKRSFGPEEKEMRRSLRRESREMRKWAIELEDRLIHEVVTSAQVIVTTLISASHRVIKDLRYQTVVIDEGSQSLEPECWNAILLARRVVLCGDHMQLPPTVKSPEADRLGLSTTLLDRSIILSKYGGLLDMQYRMHDAILSFSNTRYYQGKLSSSPEVAHRLLRGDQEPLTFIDTVGCGFEEEMHVEQRSYFNPGEYFIIREHLLLHHENLLGVSIGIITPYAEQVRYIRAHIATDNCWNGMDVEVNSIDGFQGQEKDLIYLSFVRSNESAEIGFLKDERRLNVALTRAKSKLIAIGDSGTLAQHELFESLIDHITSTGTYDSGWSYMA